MSAVRVVGPSEVVPGIQLLERVEGTGWGWNVVTVALPAGGILVHSPSWLDERTLERVSAVGAPKVLFVPNHFHHVTLERYRKAFPEALCVASEAALPRLVARKHPPLQPLSAAGPLLPEGAHWLTPPGTKSGESWLSLPGSGGPTWLVCDALFNVVRPVSGLMGFILTRLQVVPGLRVSRTYRWLALKEPQRYAGWVLEAIRRERPRTLVVSHGQPVSGEDLPERMEAAIRCSQRWLRRLALPGLLVATLLSSGARAELPPSAAPDLDAELRRVGFSGVISVQAAGQPVYQFSSPAGLGGQSVFWVGSVSKQFASVAALRLVEQGRLSLDEPVAPKLGLAPGALSRDGATCTLAQVLHHTCGLPSGLVCAINSLDEEGPQRRFLRCVEALALESAPGAKYAYSNVGFDLVGVLVARTAGLPYGAFLERELLAPLNLRSTGVRLAGPARDRLVQGEAFTGFGWAGTWPWLLLDPAGPGTLGASGNVFSTADDLHAWNRALHGGRVLKAETYSRLTTPELDKYGLGVVLEETKDGTRWIWHNGSLSPMGWSSLVAYVPSKGLSVVGLANRTRNTSHVMSATRGVVLTLLGELTRSPELEDLSDRDLAVEMVFFVFPLVVLWSVLWLSWTLLRGPRGRPVRWYATLLVNAALVLLGATMFDFFDRAKVVAPALLGIVALGLVLRRSRLDLAFRASWVDRKERWKVLSYLVAAGALSYVSGNTARLWLAGFVVAEGLLVFWLARRRASGQVA
ncbi:MAG: serine hydrolase domain-containing protein [Myxococcaceae bacterium]